VRSETKKGVERRVAGRSRVRHLHGEQLSVPGGRKGEKEGDERKKARSCLCVVQNGDYYVYVYIRHTKAHDGEEEEGSCGGKRKKKDRESKKMDIIDCLREGKDSVGPTCSKSKKREDGNHERKKATTIVEIGVRLSERGEGGSWGG